MASKSPLVEIDRLRPIEDPREDYPELDFTGSHTLHLSGEDLLITDPVFLADVYNPNDDPVAAHIWSVGVVVGDFGGDSSCAVLWQDPFLVLPLSLGERSDPELIAGVNRVAEEVGCDSGSFVFLPLRDNDPPAVRAAVEKVISERNGARLQLPAGIYRVCYAQHDPPQGWPASFGRDIVVWRQG